MASSITSSITVEAKKRWLNGDFGTSDTYKCALIKGTTGTLTFNKNKDSYDDLSTDEISGTGYTAGGVTITKTAGPGTTTGSETNGFLDFTDAQWTSATFSDVRGCVIYNDSDANNTALCWINFGAEFAVTSGTFTIEWPAAAESTAIIRIA